MAKTRPRGATSQERTDRAAIERIRGAGINSSPKREDSDDSADSQESEKNNRNSDPSKLPPYKGGTRARVANGDYKLPQSVEFEFNKTGEFNKLIELGRKRKRADQELHGALLECIHSSKSSPQHEANTLFKRITAHKVVILRSGLLAQGSSTRSSTERHSGHRLRRSANH